MCLVWLVVYQVCTNGIISFGSGIRSYSPTAFPTASNPVVAPFWGDVDTRSSGIIYYRWAPTLPPPSPSPPTPWWRPSGATSTRAPAELYITGELLHAHRLPHRQRALLGWRRHAFPIASGTIYYRWVHYILQVSALYTTGECTIYYRWVHYILQVSSHTPTAFLIASEPVVAPFWAEVDTRSSSTIYYRWVHYILQVSALYITGECTINYKWVHYIL